MKGFRQLVATFTGGLMLASIVGALTALLVKRRLVPVDAADADDVRLTAILEPISFRSTAAAFRGGSVDFWYGGGVIDLRDAILDPAGARLQVRAIFGGGQILVPETWRVSSKVLGIGGLADARARVELAADAPHLTIEGTAIFGGFRVASDIPEAEARELAEAVARFADRKHPAVVAGPEAALAI